MQGREDERVEDLLRISTCVLVGRLGGTSLAVGRGLGNIPWAGTRGSDGETLWPLSPYLLRLILLVQVRLSERLLLCG